MRKTSNRGKKIDTPPTRKGTRRRNKENAYKASLQKDSTLSDAAVSLVDMSGTEPMTAPDMGLFTAKVSPDSADTHFPLTTIIIILICI